MKLSFTAKIRLIILLLFIISLIQAILIFHLVGNFSTITELKMNIQNTLYITIFFQFVLALILIFYIPTFLRKTFSGIHKILKEISKGIYSIDIDIENFEASLDKEFYSVMLSIKEMLESVKKFDELKKDKIVEDHNRILALLNLAEHGFIILDEKGNIVFLNDKVTDVYPSVQQEINILDTYFPPEIENNIKKYILSVIKNKTKQDYHQFFSPLLKRHIGLNSAIVRDSKGEPKGAVISITNLEKKKQDKNKEQEF